MSSPDYLAKTQAYSAAALARMLEAGVPPTPQNYMLWYHYCVGGNPDLSRTIDALLSVKGHFDRELSEELFEEFFGGGKREQVALDASRLMLLTLTEVFNHIGLANNEANQYGAALRNFAGDIADADSVAGLEELLRGMLLETRTMVERNTLLEQHLQASSHQVEKLRNNLETARHEAATDGLTGIANRREFERQLRVAITDADATHGNLCLLIADIDHFKQFNESWGHQIGDQVLRLVARTMTAGTKGQDIVARYGGEEFAVILPRTRLADATVVAEHIRKDVANGEIIRRSTGEKVGRITLSQGAAAYRHGEPLDDFIARADAALFLAKRRGRNCVIAEGALAQGTQHA